METIMISRVVHRDGRQPWKVYDGNGVEYVTWDDSIGAAADALLEQQAKISYEVQEKPGRDGVVFKNRLLKEVDRYQEERTEARGSSESEPSVNTGKQVVIIRQNAWSQTNSIYEKAVTLYKELGFGNFDIQSVHAIAWQLFSANKKPENATMQTMAYEIEKIVRDNWFPFKDDEIPF